MKLLSELSDQFDAIVGINVMVDKGEMSQILFDFISVPLFLDHFTESTIKISDDMVEETMNDDPEVIRHDDVELTLSMIKELSQGEEYKELKLHYLGAEILHSKCTFLFFHHDSLIFTLIVSYFDPPKKIKQTYCTIS